MESPFPEYTESLKKNIRKCRKKLRQIENLEVLKRSLTSEEREKVSKKVDIRAELKYLISEYEENTNKSEQIEPQNESDDVEEMKRPHSSTNGDEGSNQQENNELIQFNDASPGKVSKTDSSNGDDLSSVPLRNEPSSKDDSPQSSSLPHTSKSCNKPSEAGVPVNQSTVSIPTKVSNKPKSTKKSAKCLKFCLSELDGHNDIVMSVDCSEDYIISSSRDTTVKIWNAKTGDEVGDLRGHTGAVTCVHILSSDQSKHYLTDLPIPPAEKSHRLIITGATDCTVRIWSLESGKQYRSIYTYNGVSALIYLPTLRCIVSGTDGGKLELWDALTGYNHHSLRAANEEIKCLKVLDDKIYSGTADCILKVHGIRDYKINTLFETELEFFTTPHTLMDVAVHFENIYCGDDHPNLKVVSWNSGKAQVMKLRNVKSGYGTSDALCINSNLLISSSYDLDTGNSVLNVRKLPTADYLYTLSSSDLDVGRILSISAVNLNDNFIRIFTGGQKLCVWDLYTIDGSTDGRSDEKFYSVNYFKELAKPAVDSDIDSEVEQLETEEEESEGSESEETPPKILYESETKPWYDTWCSII